MLTLNKSAFIRKESRPNARVQLICFTYAGSSAQVFHGWNAYAPEWMEVSGFELPGHIRRLREKLLDNHQEVAVAIADALESIMDRPYALFGHCMGAALAYETTRVLYRRELRPPLHLFASGARSPEYGLPIDDVDSMDDEAFIAYLGETYAIPVTVLQDPEMRRLFLPILRADTHLARNYRYTAGPPFSCGITAMAGKDDPFIGTGHLEDWSRQTTHLMPIRRYPGGHLFFEECVPQVMADIVRELEPYVL